MSMGVTDSGPVLRTTGAVLRATGRVDPDDQSIDRGLWVNARELRDAIEKGIRSISRGGEAPARTHR